MKNNIENKIKETFKNREIKPSKNAWKVLNTQLEVTQTKKENKKLKFLAYAAVFIGLLFGLMTFINSNKKNVDKPVVVDTDTNSKIEIINDNSEVLKQITTKTQVLTKESVKIKNEIILKQELANVTNKNKQIRKPKNKITSNVHKNIQVASNNIIKEEKQEIINKQNISSISEKTQLTKIVVPNINSNVINDLNKKPKTTKKKLFTSEKNIDLMLATALNKTDNKSIKKVKIHTVYLQYRVENEINTPIKNKILKTLKAGVDTVEEYITSNN